MATGRIRLADSDRREATDALTEHFAHGRLDTGELDERLDAAHAARFPDDLRALFADLPAPRPSCLGPIAGTSSAAGSTRRDRSAGSPGAASSPGRSPERRQQWSSGLSTVRALPTGLQFALVIAALVVIPWIAVQLLPLAVIGGVAYLIYRANRS